MENAIFGIRAVVDAAEKMKNAYFFTPPCNAAARRSYETRNSAPLVEWEDGGNTYTAEYTVSCSCQHVYARGVYTKKRRENHVDGYKKQPKTA